MYNYKYIIEILEKIMFIDNEEISPKLGYSKLK